MVSRYIFGVLIINLYNPNPTTAVLNLVVKTETIVILFIIKTAELNFYYVKGCD